MRNILIAGLLLLMIISFNGCLYDKGDMAVPDIDTLPDTVSYSSEIKPILVTYCYGTGVQLCHVTNTNQGSSGDSTTYAGLKEKVDNGTIALRVFTSNGGMPPSYSLSPVVLDPVDLKKFKDWVAIGAPDN